MRRVSSHQIWIGHAGDGRDAARLLDAGIQAVVQLAIEEPPLQLPREIVVCRFPLVDGGENDPKLLLLAIRTVTLFVSNRVPTLVCCSAGLSRGPAIAAAAMAKHRGSAVEHCLSELASLGPVDVSPALWRQVRETLDG